MSLQAVWAFENELATVLQDQGWQPESTSPSATGPDAVTVYTYTGSPARYSLALDIFRFIIPPAQFQPTAHIGCWAAPILITSPGNNREVMRHDGISPNTNASIRTASTTTFGLYVANILRATSQNMNLSIWHYVCLKSDMRTNPYLTEMWIDGVQEGTSSVAAADQTNSTFQLEGASGGPIGVAMFVGGLAFWSEFSDPAEVPAFCTTVNPNDDGAANTGTWVSTGGNDFSVLAGALDVATNTAEASPNSGDRVNCTIDAGGSDDLADQLGISPSIIYGLSLHTWSVGESINARAVIGEAAAEVNGPSVAISPSNTTYAHAIATVSPDTSVAWTGASQPILNYVVI